MACQQLSGITFSCLQNTGGVTAIYIALYDNVIASATTFNAIGQIENISLVSGTYFEQFQFNRDTSSFEENTMINLPNGTTYYDQVVSLKIPRRDAAKRNSLLVLANGQPLLVAIVEDYNGLLWYVGLVNGAYLTSIKSGTGVKKSDANGYDVVLTGEEPQPAAPVDPTIMAALIDPTIYADNG